MQAGQNVDVAKSYHLFVSPDRSRVAEVAVMEVDERAWDSLPESRDKAWVPHRREGRVRAVRLIS